MANLFYPNDGQCHKGIVHLNGGVPLLQDGRSILLAHQGFTVLEIGYNLIQYGQLGLFDRHPVYDAMKVEHFVAAIRRFLKHPKTYGDRVALIGQCKGGDLAQGIASLCPELVELVVTNSCYLINPLVTDLTFGSKRFPTNWPIRPWYNDESSFTQKDDVYYVKGDQGFFTLFQADS